MSDTGEPGQEPGGTQGQEPTAPAATEPTPSAPQGQEPDPAATESGTQGTSGNEPEQDQIQKLRDEAASRRRQVREVEETLTKVKADMAKQLEDAQADASQTIRDLRIENAVVRQAVTRDFIDPEAAYRLLDTTDLTVDEDGAVTGVADALDKLAETKPFLLRPNAPGDGPDSGTPRGTSGGMNDLLRTAARGNQG